MHVQVDCISEDKLPNPYLQEQEIEGFHRDYVEFDLSDYPEFSHEEFLTFLDEHFGSNNYKLVYADLDRAFGNLSHLGIKRILEIANGFNEFDELPCSHVIFELYQGYCDDDFDVLLEALKTMRTYETKEQAGKELASIYYPGIPANIEEFVDYTLIFDKIKKEDSQQVFIGGCTIYQFFVP